MIPNSFRIKIQALQILNRTGVLQNMIARSRLRIILACHRVIPRSRASELGLHPSMFITPQSFRTLLYAMKKMGTFVDIYTLLSGSPSRTSFAITFDDGWSDTYTIAFPILKELGIPFSLFISTSLIEKGNMNWTEEIISQYVRLSKIAPERATKALNKLRPQGYSGQNDIYELIEILKELPYDIRNNQIESFYGELDNNKPIEGEMLSWHQIYELRKEGVIIGSHTHSHSILSDLNRERVTEELQLSKKIIGDQLAYDSNVFCYPNGRYKLEYEDIYSSLGYKYGFILDDKTVHGDESPFFIPRFLVYEDIIPLLYFRFLTEYK